MASQSVPNIIYGFHHICFDKNGQQVFEEQFKIIKESGLYDASHTIFCSVLGNKNNYALPDKYQIIFEATSGKVYERPILEFMQKTAAHRPGKYWYIHTKGLSHYGTPNYDAVRDWRVYMEYFLIKGWQRCVKDLDTYDIAGVQFVPNTSHYSGNFWWARSTYLSTNPTNFNYRNYVEAELWLCRGTPPPIGISYHISNVNHYYIRYLPEMYEPEVKKQLAVIFTPGISEIMCDSGQHSRNLDFDNFASADTELIIPTVQVLQKK
jgi:hypothetical protein